MTHEKSEGACMHSEIEKLKTRSLFVVHKEPGIKRSDKNLILYLTDLPKNRVELQFNYLRCDGADAIVREGHPHTLPLHSVLRGSYIGKSAQKLSASLVVTDHPFYVLPQITSFNGTSSAARSERRIRCNCNPASGMTQPTGSPGCDVRSLG